MRRLVKPKPCPMKDWERIGWIGRKGYREGRLEGHMCLLHRAIWAYVHGEWPTREIDHINGDRSDNRLGNLRLCDRSSNMANRGPTRKNSSGYKGVYWEKPAKRWIAEICVGYKRRKLGRFTSAEAASAAYKAAALEAFGPFARFE